LTAYASRASGWKSYYGVTLKNEGDCVSYVATHGKNALPLKARAVPVHA
jgi:hypothetical protein